MSRLAMGSSHTHQMRLLLRSGPKDINVLVRYKSAGKCPHQYAAVICNGFLEEKTVTCPLHGWIYSLESGKALGSNARLLTYHIFEDEGLVWLEQPKKTRPLWLENF